MARPRGLLGRALDRLEETVGWTFVDSEHLRVTEAVAAEATHLASDLEEIGYTAMDFLSGRPNEPSATSRRRWAKQARVVWQADPQAGAAVELLNEFTFGRGIPRPRAKDKEVQKVIDEFWDDPQNQRVLTSFGAQMRFGNSLSIQSNVWFLVFDEGDDGRVRCSYLNHDLVETYVVDPENRQRVLYFLARKSRDVWDYQADKPKPVDPGQQPKLWYYEVWGAIDEALEERGAKRSLREGEWLVEADREGTVVARTRGGGWLVEADDDGDGKLELAPKDKRGEGKVYHVVENTDMEQVLGVPRMRRTLRWYASYNKYMAARVDMMMAAAAFVMRRKVKGTPAALERLAAKGMRASSDLRATISSASTQATLGPTPASILQENQNVEHEPFNIDTRAGNAQQDAQMLRAQVSAGDRFPQHYLGDVGSANLATATCYDGETETLTEDGWLGLGELKRRAARGEMPRIASYDTVAHALVYAVPESGLLLYPYQGKMARFQTDDGFDMLVTPNHRMLVRQGDTAESARDYEWIEAAKLSSSRRYARMSAPLAQGVRVEEFVLPGCLIYHGNGRGKGVRVLAERVPLTLRMDAWLLWLGWYISEGSEGGTITQSVDSPFLPDVQAACRALGVPAIEKVKIIGGREHWVWKPRNVKQFRVWLDEHVGVGAASKRVPEFVFRLDPEQQRLVLRGLMGGDGHTPDGWETQGSSTYWTTSRQCADDVQRLALHVGMRAKVRREAVYETKCGTRESWVVALYAGRCATKRADYAVLPRPEWIDYDGEVYCFTLPHSTIVTRRNGKVAISGQSMELPVLKHVEARQELVEGLFRFLLDRVIERAVEAGRLSTEAPAESEEEPELVGTSNGRVPEGRQVLAESQPMVWTMNGTPKVRPTRITTDGESIFYDLLEAHEDKGVDEDETGRDLSYEFGLPSPLRRMMGEVVSAANTVAQFADPNNTNPELTRTLLTIVLAEAFELQDAPDVVDRIFPKGYVPPELAQMLGQQAPPGRQPGTPNFFGPESTEELPADVGNAQGATPYGTKSRGTLPEEMAQEAEVEEVPPLVTVGRAGQPVFWPGRAKPRVGDVPPQVERRVAGRVGDLDRDWEREVRAVSMETLAKASMNRLIDEGGKG